MAGKRQVIEGPGSALDHALMQRDSRTVDMVRRAIEHRQVLMAYQPIVTTSWQDAPAYYESLVRVTDETGRIVPAKDFITAVEDTEHGRMLDCIALEKSLEELRREPNLRLAVNMSARSIGYKKWMRSLQRGLSADPTVAERLILEITEHSAMMVPELVVDFMSDLQRKGVAFAIDDFGTGYTALRFFKDFSFDILKIDGQFIRGVAGDADNQVLVGAMVAIARQFDMYTVAEQVENLADVECLIGLGVDALQGYYFAAPTISPPWRAQDDKAKTG